jgi:hypothetical protein
MRPIDSYAITWFKLFGCNVYCIANMDELEIPFLRVTQDENYSDILLSLEPVILDGENIEFTYFKNFIIENYKLLMEHWNCKVTSDELINRVHFKEIDIDVDTNFKR